MARRLRWSRLKATLTSSAWRSGCSTASRRVEYVLALPLRRLSH